MYPSEGEEDHQHLPPQPSEHQYNMMLGSPYLFHQGKEEYMGGHAPGEKQAAYSNDVMYSASIVRDMSERYHEMHHSPPPPPPYYGVMYSQYPYHHQEQSHYGHAPYHPPPHQSPMEGGFHHSPEKKKSKRKSEDENMAENQQQVICGDCGKEFKNKSSLQSHRKIHTSNVKQHVCPICTTSFSRSHGNFVICLHALDLKRHEYIHTKDKPFICSGCKRGFSRRDALKRHIDSMAKRGGCALE
jgi:hypothetical protein